MEAGAESKRAESEQRELDRVGAFSDGVFAVAITLLVLNIEVPPVSADGLDGALEDLVPDVTAYFIAFAVIGLFWYGHHRAWSSFRRSTPKLVWSNMLLLSLIALMPFTTALMGRFDEAGDELAVVLYALNVGLAACADTFVDKVAFDQGIARVVSAGERRAQIVTGWLRPAIFFGSIPVALLIGATVAQLSWLLLLLLPWVGGRVERRTESAQEAAS
ncbi:MAG: TMEM175 family protein [Solirubrobacterales bacterium]